MPAYLIRWSGRIDPDGNAYIFLHSGAPQNNAEIPIGRRPGARQTPAS